MVVWSRLSSFRYAHIDQRKCVRFGRVRRWSVRSFVNHQGYVSWLRFWIESGLSYMTKLNLANSDGCKESVWPATELRHFFRLFICRVIGPRILINCQSPTDIRNISSPIFNLAMKDVIVCVSGVNFEKRSEIHKLVGFMDGLSSEDLLEATTHLITNTVKSPKYQVRCSESVNQKMIQLSCVNGIQRKRMESSFLSLHIVVFRWSNATFCHFHLF